MRGLFGVRFFNGLRVGKLKKGVGFYGSGAVRGLFGVRFLNGLRVGKLKKGVGVCGSGAVRGLCIFQWAYKKWR